jgi:3-methylcrotonyl-CoA carboxylase beta subunit
MTDIQTTLDTESREFGDNAEAMKGLVADLRAQLDIAMQGGSEEARARHVTRGKLLARERVGRARHVRRRRSCCEPDHRHRPRQRP